jgi:serine protease
VSLTATDNAAESTTATQVIEIAEDAVAKDFICGDIFIPSNTVIDTDRADPATFTTIVTNNSFATAQPLPNPAQVVGHLNLSGFGSAGSPTFTSGDAQDIFSIQASGGEIVNLSINDGALSDLTANFGFPHQDIILTLYDSNQAVIGQSTGTNRYRSVTIPSVAGAYFIGVEIQRVAVPETGGFQANSNYSLTVTDSTITVVDSGEKGRHFTLDDDFVPGEIIVAYRNDGDINTHALPKIKLQKIPLPSRPELYDEDSLQLVKGKSGIAGHTKKQYATLRLAQKAATLNEIQRLARREDVIYAEPNFIRQLAATPNDTSYPQQWYLNKINLPAAWDITKGSDSVIVAVLDSGAVLTHSDLDSRYTTDGYDFVSQVSAAGSGTLWGSEDGDGMDSDPTDPGDPLDANGCEQTGADFHGTAVAGIIGAETDNNAFTAGVTWLGKIMPIRVTGGCGGYAAAADVSGNSGTSFDIANGIRYAAGLTNPSGALPIQPADIINMSFNSAFFSQTEQNAVNAARAAGVILVAASGNQGSSVLQYPASYAGVISVSGTDNNNVLGTYSGTGSAIDVAAPGGVYSGGVTEVILTANWSTEINPNEFVQFARAGTSLAAPQVSGVIALMKAVYPSLKPEDVDTLLAAGSMTTDLGAAGRDDLYGWGLIDAHKSVLAAQDLAAGGSGGGDGGTPIVVISPPASLTAEPVAFLSAIDFGYSLTQLSFELSTTNAGAIVLNAASSPQAWIKVKRPESTDGMGLYHVNVDRTALTPGVHTGSVNIEVEGLGTFLINIDVQVLSSERLLAGTGGNLWVAAFTGSAGTWADNKVIQPAADGSYTYQLDVTGLTSVHIGAVSMVANQNSPTGPNLAECEFIACTDGELLGGFGISGNMISRTPQPQPITIVPGSNILDADIQLLVWHRLP